MSLPLYLLTLLFTVPFHAFACEGECIVGVTKVFLNSYSTPVYNIFNTIANQIEQSIIPSHSRTESSLDYISPILSGYEQQCYAGMETAIFPSYFHGKCQDQNGALPQGCPNPDCPVVCGTPGSLVHFYSKLRRIAFSQTQQLLTNLSKPDSDTYKAVESTVLKYINKPIPRMIRRRRDLPFALDQESSPLAKRAEDAKGKLRTIMDRVPSTLEVLCGGISSNDGGSDDELVNCSWKTNITGYILKFP